MIDKRKKPTRGLIGGGNAKKGGAATDGAAARRARGRRRTYPQPGETLNARTRAIFIFILISAAFCALSGLVGPWSRSAFAADGYTHTFPNGNTVEVHPDGTVTGTCVMSGNAVVGGKFSGNVTMPDGATYPALCYEAVIGVPNHSLYPGPCDGAYPFEAKRNPNGTYFVLIKSQNAAAGAPGTVPSTYPYQRCCTREWKLALDVDVEFAKRSKTPNLTDGNSAYALGGASFDIYDAADERKVTSITMDAGGKARCKLAPNKNYYAVETKAPQGYKLHQGRIPFHVDPKGTAIVFEDAPGTVSLTVRKQDAATGGGAQRGLSLKGAQYEVTSLSTQGWKTHMTTDERGVATAMNIPLGRISVVETKAPEGYRLDPTVHTYEVNGGQLGTSGVFELSPKEGYGEVPRAFDIEVVKYLENGNEGSGLQKPGAKVRFDIISNSTGKTVGSITTDDRGRASSAGRWFGEGSRIDGIKGAIPYDRKGYTVHEDPDSTPAGYQPCPDWVIGTDQMVDGSTLHYIVDNDFVGSRVQIVKCDATSGQPIPLEGFAFQVLDKHKKPISQEVWHPNHAVMDTFTTDATGCVTLPEPLEPGTYYIREMKAVKPYLINGDEIEFDIADDAETQPLTVVRISDERATGSASIVKRCADDTCPWCEEGNAIEGARFIVVAMEDIVNPSGSVDMPKGATVELDPTDESGVACIDGLPLGSGNVRYAFVEVEAAPGHILDPTPIPFTLSWVNAETPVVDIEVTHQNAPTETVIHKTDASTGAPLAGASFDVWPRQLEFKQQVEPERMASDGNLGSLLITNCIGARDWENVEIRLDQKVDYALARASVPVGYSLHLTRISDSGEKEAGTFEPDVMRSAERVTLGDTDDMLAPGTYRIDLLDADGTAVHADYEKELRIEAGTSHLIAYVPGIFGMRGRVSVETRDIELESYETDDFDLNGDLAIIRDVKPGSYRLSTTSTSDEKLSAKTDVEIAFGEPTHVQWRESQLYRTDHTLVPYAKKYLDAAFSRAGISTVTDEHGDIALTHLPMLPHELDALFNLIALEEQQDQPRHMAGPSTREAEEEALTWCVQEMHAPAGYVANREVHTYATQIMPNEEGVASQRIDIANDYTKVEITKRASETEEPLAGALLELTDGKGNVIESWTSTTETHRIERLEPGSYTLTELRSPHTHEPAAALTFNVKPTTDVQMVSLHDSPISVSGKIDKRQEIAKPVAPDAEANGDGLNRAKARESEDGSFSYALDYRNDSSSWVDEFTVEDNLDAAENGMAELTGITTGRSHGDYDGKLNVWYRTNLNREDDAEEKNANATLTDGHVNPWLDDAAVANIVGADGRVKDYGGWRLWKEGVSATESTFLSVSDLPLESGEAITDIRLEYGCVNKDFTSRPSQWDGADIKHPHDDWNPVPPIHGKKQNADGESTDAYAPTLIHMRALPAYTGGSSIDNRAHVSLYRNGGGEGLEAHDSDAVHQEAAKVQAHPIISLDQTGAAPLLRTAVGLSIASIVAAGYAWQRKRWRSGRTASSAGLRPKRDCGRGTLGSRITHIR